MSTDTEMQTGNTALLRTGLTMSVVSLVLSGWAFVTSLDDDALERRTEQRLACLELPGPNDCGLDGR